MEDLENIFANLKINSDSSSAGDADKYFEEIDIALKKNETTTKWLDDLGKDAGPVTNEEFTKLFDKSQNPADDFTSTLEGDAEPGAIRYSVVELIAKKCLQVEIKTQRNEFQEASTDAMNIVKFINKHRAYYAEKEYMVGFRYVANCLAIKAQLKDIRKKNASGKFNISRLKELLAALNEYQHFEIQPQVGVLAIKQYFAGYLRKGCCHDFQLSLVKMDPENLEWRFCLYSVLRFKRTDAKYFSAPSQEEIDVINEASEKRYAMFDARICLGYAFCLAEILKTSGKMILPLKYGKATFYRVEEILQCIRAKVDDVLAIDPTSVRSNIDVAKIYSTLLPPTHRDIAFAMVCIKRALLFNPNSSKANHRMAVLLISTNSSDEAVEYLQKAIENDDRNVFAAVDLLKVYMGNIPTNKIKIEQIFSNPTYKVGKNYADILLLKAVYTYLSGNINKSIDLLIEAVTNNAKCIDSLERMHSNFKRCKWGDYKSFSQNIKKLVESRMTLCGRGERDILNAIWKSLKDVNEYGNNREQFKYGRGDYEDFFNRSRGSYRPGGSSYHSGNKERNTGGSRPGSSSHDSGKENKSGGSQTKSFKLELDDYAVLGLSKTTATLSDVKKQYRKLALEHHPDKNMNLSPDELFKKQELMKRINSAYHTLSTQIKT